MSFLDIKPNEAVDPIAVEAGEHELSILAAEIKESRNNPGRQMIEVTFSIADEPNAKSVRDWLLIPNDEDDEGSANRKLRRIRDFCRCFDYDPDGGIETEDLVGLSGRCILGIQTTDDYGDQNNIRRYTYSA